MLAGNPNRRVNDPSNKMDNAVSFVCLDYYEDHSSDPEWAERGGPWMRFLSSFRPPTMP